jgi:hypothetical protein
MFQTFLCTMLNDNILKIPTFQHELLVKMTHSGVTVLKDGKFRSRIQGSRSHTMLPNAVLVDNTTLQSIEQGKDSTAVRKLHPTCTQLGEEKFGKEKKSIEYHVNKKLVRARVYAYIMAMQKPVLHAVTISFPPCITDDIGYKLLNTWLTVCRKSLHLREYLFVAERQKIGTVHFHLLVPQFINIHKANRAMAVCICTLIKKGQLNWHRSAAKRYNGVDIAKNRNTKRVTNFALGSSKKVLAHYITKYISKNQDGFKHYAWHNSRGFSSMMTSISLTEAEAKSLFIRPLLNMEKPFVTEWAKFYYWVDGAHSFFTNCLKFVNAAILNKGPGKLRQKMEYSLN